MYIIIVVRCRWVECRRDVTDLDDDDDVARYRRRKFFYPSFRLLRNIFSVPTPPPHDPYAAWSANSRHRASPISARARAIEFWLNVVAAYVSHEWAAPPTNIRVFLLRVVFRCCLFTRAAARPVRFDWLYHNIIMPHGNNNNVIIPVVVVRYIVY